jgi:hypothetical protein
LESDQQEYLGREQHGEEEGKRDTMMTKVRGFMMTKRKEESMERYRFVSGI